MRRFIGVLGATTLFGVPFGSPLVQIGSWSLLRHCFKIPGRGAHLIVIFFPGDWFILFYPLVWLWMLRIVFLLIFGRFFLLALAWDWRNAL